MSSKEQIQISEKEEQRRQMILNGELYKTILIISAPVALYNLINQFFNFFNSLIVADLGKEIFSMVSYVSSLQFMLSSIGAGLSVGGGILIAKYYGQGDFNKTKEYIINLILFSLFLSGLIFISMVPFAELILTLSGVPKEVLDVGTLYFRIEVMSVICMFINQIYMTIEKARGNTKSVMNLNIGVIVLKLLLTYIFVVILKYGVISVAVSTFVSHFSMTLFATFHMIFNKSNPFKMNIKTTKFKFKIISDIFTLSFPIMFEKIAFSFGKVYVNTLGSIYSPTAVGALGVSNQMGGMITIVPQGFQSGESTIISQNIGNKNINRAIDTFKATLVINVIYSIISLILVYLYMDQLIGLFAKNDVAFANEIEAIFKSEMLATIALSISTSVLGLLYGFGHTVMSLFINMMRIFIFRIPVVLFFVHFTTFGVESLGYAMFISNLCVGIVSIIYAVYVIRKLKKTHNLNYKFFTLKKVYK